MISGEAVNLLNASDVGTAIGGSLTSITSQIGSIGTWLQAIGFIVILWIVFQIIAFILNLKKERKLKRMEASIARIEAKIDRISKRRK